MMLVAQIFFWTIGIMFLAGMVGSAVVVVLTSLEDAKELKGESKEGMVDVSSPHISRAQPTA
jgi:hypothetical protein